VDALPSSELTRWQAFASREFLPGGQREDLQAARIQATVLSLFLKPGSEPISPLDLLPDPWKERQEKKREQTPEEMKLALMTYGGLAGARPG
jgi:hypothetical protein